MKKGKGNKILSSYKKDSNGLFDGGFKAGEMDTKLEKEDRRKMSTNDWLEYAEEQEMDHE